MPANILPGLAKFAAPIVRPIVATFTPKPTLTLERNGNFDVDAIDVSCKCGPVGANTITYKVRVECKDKLDVHGFLIDHNEIHGYMESTFGGFQPVFPSCERIAERSASGLWGMLQRHGCKPVRLHVTVAAFGQAGVTAKLGKAGDI